MLRNLLFGIVFLLTPLTVMATPQSHPIAVRLGSSVHATGLHLRFDTQPIDQALEAFTRAAPSDAADRVAKAFFRATLDRNAVAVGRWLDRRGLKGTPADAIALWHRGFYGFAGARVVSRVSMGDATLFLWTAQKPDGPWLRGLYVFPRGQGLKADFVDSRRPKVRLVLKTVEAQRTHQFPAQNAPQGNYALDVLPGVQLEFQGQQLNYDVMSQSPPSNPALIAYGELMGVLRSGRIGPFAQRHDADSQNKIMAWYQSKPDQMRSWWRYVRENRQALLHVDAGPFALIFVAEGPAVNAPQRVVRWDWLQRRPDGTWRPVKFQRYDAIDEVFEKGLLPRSEEDFHLVLQGGAR